MSHTDYRTLIDRGRKSGLNTTELYSALTGRPPMTGDFRNGPSDTNGFGPALDEHGHRIYKPQDTPGTR